MIHVGDKVKITDTEVAYSAYSGFLNYYREVGSSTMIERVCSQYAPGRAPTQADALSKVFTVMFVREHDSLEGRKLAIINDGNITYIIGIEGLTIVSSDLPFTEGDKVFITDPMRVYSSWEELIKHASTVIPDGVEVYNKWTDNHSPLGDEIGGKSPDSVFTVKWIGHHVSRPNDDILAIISNNTHTYIMSTKGLARAGESSWDKYVIYVRNWAVVNKETAQSVRDATGPKSYAEWLNGRK